MEQILQIKCKDEEILLANGSLLSLKSEYFRRFMDFEERRDQAANFCCDLSQFRKKHVEIVVASLTQPVEIPPEDIFILWELADYLQMEELLETVTNQILREITVENVLTVFDRARATNQDKVAQGCIVFMSHNLLALHSSQKLKELQQEILNEVLDLSMKLLNDDLEIVVQFTEKFYELSKDLDVVDRFKNAIRHKKDLLYFALTMDMTIFTKNKTYRQFSSYTVDIKENMKIEKRSELGRILTPLCPRPLEDIPFNWGHVYFWTEKFGNMFNKPYLFGPKWHYEGHFSKIKFFFEELTPTEKFLCGLSIRCENEFNNFGCTDSQDTQELIISKDEEIKKIGLFIQEDTRLISAIQVITRNNHYRYKTSYFPSDFKPPQNYDQDTLWYGENRPWDPWASFLKGIKGRSVRLKNKDFLCDIQILYNIDMRIKFLEEERKMEEYELYQSKRKDLPVFKPPTQPLLLEAFDFENAFMNQM